MFDVVVPTCKDLPPVETMLKSLFPESKIIVTGLNASASTNRNFGLNQCESEFVLMLDDDIFGLFPAMGEMLITPMLADQNVKMVQNQHLIPYLKN